jgi:hypothetical protein
MLLTCWNFRREGFFIAMLSLVFPGAARQKKVKQQSATHIAWTFTP